MKSIDYGTLFSLSRQILKNYREMLVIFYARCWLSVHFWSSSYQYLRLKRDVFVGKLFPRVSLPIRCSIITIIISHPHQLEYKHILHITITAYIIVDDR